VSGARQAGARQAGAQPSPGRPSPAERRERRASESDPAVVLAAAVRFLESRQRSIREVRRRLGQAGYPAPLIDAAVERLEELGFLDDEAFARAWVESRDRARPRGERALRSELALKGIARDIVDRVLAERRPADDGTGGDRATEDAAAGRLLERRGRALLRIADPRVRRNRAYALLARNGFDPDVAGRVSRALTSDEEGAGEA
jgi:regulatory protein